ncbi:MAG: electron transport complex subunit RsxC [Mariprofundaceae bacterium]|nr:electron transport complex subunit RsxC [Mariprofundaceae bacterium]
MIKSLLNKLGFASAPFAGGITPDMCKWTENAAIEDCPLPPLFIVPIKQHIGQACSPLVQVGDLVLRGQKIAKSEGYLSVPIHAPTSGKVIKIEEHAIPHPSGMGLTSIFIEPDGKDERDTSLAGLDNWQTLDPAELRERVRLCGIAGLGGAAFPTFIKLLKDKRNPIETIILNGIECEPFLTNDHRLMVENSAEIVHGLQIIMHMVDAKKAIIAIEDNKLDAINAMQQALSSIGNDTISVASLPTRYPQGSEKQLIESLTGKQVPIGKLPMHAGVLCQNIATVKAINDAIMLGYAITDRIITVSGDAVPKPTNMRVRLGTPMRFIYAQRGLENFDGIQILHGGPMMGERMRHPDIPVVKSSTGLLAITDARIKPAHQVEDPCIRCGHCSEVCPISLVPNLLADHCRNDQLEKAADYDLFDCIECGACSYVCPSHIPLVHYFRYGKGQTAQVRREQSFAEVSRLRSEGRDARLQREKDEKAAKRRKVRDTLRSESVLNPDNDAKAKTSPTTKDKE